MLALRWFAASVLFAAVVATPIAADSVDVALVKPANPAVEIAAHLALVPTATVKTSDERNGGTVTRALPSSTVTCGTVKYTVARIVAAVNAGGARQASGSTVNGYPHRFYNYEGLNMWCSSASSGPWYEFPILSSGSVYTSGSPGADRVVFTTNSTYCATITHTGASTTNGFVQCQND